MTIAKSSIWVFQFFRLYYQVFLLHNLERVIDVQLKIRHDSQMIPKFVLEIRHITQMREHATHDVDNCVCTALTFCTVFDCQRMIHHILYTSPIFGQFHFLSLGIIFHTVKLVFWVVMLQIPSNRKVQNRLHP